jgi:hypothetical protein
MGRQLRCRTCGDPIDLVGRPGFIVRGQPKYFAVNPDDRQPHARRCKLTMDLRAARRPRTALPKNTGSLGTRSSGATTTNQGELFK